MSRQRLHKIMAACGVGSRRACETLIAEGRVAVDGEVVTTPGTQVDPDTQEIRVDTERLSMGPRHYYLLNKPRGVVCSQSVADDTLRAVDLLPASARDLRVFTIGRLDVDSEGALILTNDGELCHLVTHPRFEVEKTYEVDVRGAPDEETLERMRKGVWLSEGRTSTLKIQVLARTRELTRLSITLNEGMKREIRRVCARFGYKVKRLVRTSIGPIQLGNLASGRTRRLNEDEVNALRDSARLVVRFGRTPPARRRSRRPGAGRARRSHGRA